jgi:hypothetical protein
MRPLRLLRGAALILLASLVPIIVGCGGIVGGEAPKSAALIQTETKVEALTKEGKSLREIRAIMKGEPLTTKKTSKKVSRKH